MAGVETTGAVRQDDEIHSPTAWRRDLQTAGWTEVNPITYRDPEGNLWRGPYGAWRELQRRKDSQ